MTAVMRYVKMLITPNNNSLMTDVCLELLILKESSENKMMGMSGHLGSVQQLSLRTSLHDSWLYDIVDH